MDFVAIDFETANHRANSACQLAAVVVRDSQIVDERCWLIRPPSNQFSRFNIAVHGIRPADVASAPNMAGIWPDFQAVIDKEILVAHNARFDVSVMLSSLAEYSIHCPDFDFHCTRALARAAWPGRPRYGLKPLGVWLGLNFKHHDALEDARVCAKIALRVESMLGEAAAFEVLESKLSVRRGKHRAGSVNLPKGPGTSGEGRIQRSDRWGFPIPSQQKQVGSICAETVKQSCLDKPLRDKRIVMLAPLRGLSFEATLRLLMELGATIQPEIDPTTNYVVAPGISVSEAQQQVDALRASSSQPVGIRVLSERQFRALLPGGAVSIQ